MYATAILMILLLISFIVSESKSYKGLRSFDVVTTLPLRGLLALLIVSHHLGQKTDIFALSNFTTGLGLQIVDVFFFISGYGLCASYLAKGRSYLNGFLRKRMGKLLPKFLILTGAMVTAYYFLASMDINAQAARMSDGWTPLPHSWFIYAIIYVYLAFYICALGAKTPLHTGILFLIAILDYIAIFNKILHFPPHWHVTIIAVNFGYFIALYENKVTQLLNNHKLISYPALVVLMVASLGINSKIVQFNNPSLELLSFTLSEIWILAQACAVYVVVRTLGFFQWGWLREVGVYSLELYLIHGIPLKIGLHLGLKNWTLWIFTFSVSITCAIILNKLFDNLLHQTKPFSA